MQNLNDRPPNFRQSDGRLVLIRCFNCDPDIGRENYLLATWSGQCAWCDWREEVGEHGNSTPNAV